MNYDDHKNPSLAPAQPAWPATMGLARRPARPAWPAIGDPAGRPENVEKHIVFIGFLYDSIAPAPPRERQLGPSGRPTQQEPFARRSWEQEQRVYAGHDNSLR